MKNWESFGQTGVFGLAHFFEGRVSTRRNRTLRRTESREENKNITKLQSEATHAQLLVVERVRLSDSVVRFSLDILAKNFQSEHTHPHTHTRL